MYEQYRTISLLSHASKVKIMFKILDNGKKTEDILSEEQFKFRKNMGTREAIYIYICLLALRLIIEKRIRKDKSTFCLC